MQQPTFNIINTLTHHIHLSSHSRTCRLWTVRRLLITVELVEDDQWHQTGGNVIRAMELSLFSVSTIISVNLLSRWLIGQKVDDMMTTLCVIMKWYIEAAGDCLHDITHYPATLSEHQGDVESVKRGRRQKAAQMTGCKNNHSRVQHSGLVISDELFLNKSLFLAN